MQIFTLLAASTALLLSASLASAKMMGAGPTGSGGSKQQVA